jgi:hypothetical protein
MSASFFNERRRRHLVPVAALALVAIYLFGFLPLDQRAKNQKEPLAKAGRTLATALGQTNGATIDFIAITNQLAITRSAVAALELARTQAAARTDLGEALRERMAAPFQLVDYENERGRQQNQLRQLAAQRKVTLAPAVLDGFPSHTFAVTQPTLLWAELALIEGLLTTAVNCNVGTIHSINVPATFTNSPSLSDRRAVTEVPMQLEFTATAPALARFLQCLPLRAEELKNAGLPDGITNKPAMFVDRLMVRKQAPEKPEEVRASLRVVGFIFHE